jgi:hypothetical protein
MVEPGAKHAADSRGRLATPTWRIPSGSIALNMPRSNNEQEIVIYLEQALGLAEIKRDKWLKDARLLIPVLASRALRIKNPTPYASGSKATATRRSSPISTL